MIELYRALDYSRRPWDPAILRPPAHLNPRRRRTPTRSTCAAPVPSMRVVVLGTAQKQFTFSVLLNGAGCAAALGSGTPLSLVHRDRRQTTKTDVPRSATDHKPHPICEFALGLGAFDSRRLHQPPRRSRRGIVRQAPRPDARSRLSLSAAVVSLLHSSRSFRFTYHLES